MITYLIGMPGCGKSKTARYLAEKYNQKIIDLDKYIEDKEGMFISNIFSKYGEEYFRKLETRYLLELTEKSSDLVISCGGGIVTKAVNKTVMKSGVTIFLDCDIKTLKSHLHSKNDRPLLKTKTVEEIYNERIELYHNFLDYRIKYTTFDMVGDKIMEIIKGLHKKKVLVVNGPNLNMLGKRNPNHYGSLTLDEINRLMVENSPFELEFFQSNHEGALIDKLQEYDNYAGIIINPGAYTHTSVALHDCLEIISIPKVEVHLSEVDNREDYRKINFVRDVVDYHCQGKKENSYIDALLYLKNKINVL